jgi:hypothetical protein
MAVAHEHMEVLLPMGAGAGPEGRRWGNPCHMIGRKGPGEGACCRAGSSSTGGQPASCKGFAAARNAVASGDVVRVRGILRRRCARARL